MPDNKTDLKRIRTENQRKTLLLLKKGSYYCKELSQKIGVSDVTMYAILKDFLQKDIACRFTASDVSYMGRKPIKYTLNKDYGIFAAVDFTMPTLKLCLHDIFGNKLAAEQFPIVMPVRQSDLKKCCERLKTLIAESGASAPLRNICISTPGRINPKTDKFIVAAIYENATEINLKKLFQDEFGCTVFVKNNLYLACNGEINKYNLFDEKDLLYLYVGDSIGGAMRVNGKIRNGSNNLAGEIAFSRTFDNKPISYNLSPEYLLDKYFGKAEKAGEKERLNHRFGDVLRLYGTGDPIATELLESAACFLSILINNFQSMFDCNTVVINSYFYLCGEKMKQYLTDRLNEFCSYYSHNVVLTEPSDYVFIDGCINYAIDKNIISTLKLG